MTVQTKENSAALNALLKAKGNRSMTLAVAKPASTIVETQKSNEPEVTPNEPTTVANSEGKVTKEVHNEGVDYEKSWKELKAHHDKSIYEERLRVKQLEEALAEANKPKIELPKTEEELEAFKASQPDVYDTITSIAIQAVAKQNSTIKKELESLNKLEQERKQKLIFQEILKEHPDAEAIRDSAQFAVWFNEQPNDIKNILGNSNDAKAICKQLTLYKLEVLGINPKEKKKKDDSEKRLEASMGVSIKGAAEMNPAKKIWTKSEIDAVCADFNTYKKYADEIDLARREGRVDLSK